LFKDLFICCSNFYVRINSYNAITYNRDGIAFDNKFHVYREQAAAGLWMTPSDLCNYNIDMQLAHKGGKSKVLTAVIV
jgi:hypothetical protein